MLDDNDAAGPPHPAPSTARALHTNTHTVLSDVVLTSICATAKVPVTPGQPTYVGPTGGV